MRLTHQAVFRDTVLPSIMSNATEIRHSACIGGKAVSAIVREVIEDPTLDVLDVSSNASVQMKYLDMFTKLAEPLKTHASLQKLVFYDCNIGDDGCAILGDILQHNHTVTELNLEKNCITADGGIALANGLAYNCGLKTLNLMHQTTSRLQSDECIQRFITMYDTNITLTRIQWRLQSNKSHLLNRLTARNVLIAQRQSSGKSYLDLLPDHMKSSPPNMSLPPEQRAARSRAARNRLDTSLGDMMVHLDTIQVSLESEGMVTPTGTPTGMSGTVTDGSLDMRDNMDASTGVGPAFGAQRQNREDRSSTRRSAGEVLPVWAKESPDDPRPPISSLRSPRSEGRSSVAEASGIDPRGAHLCGNLSGNAASLKRASLTPSESYHAAERLSLREPNGSLRKSIANCQAALWHTELSDNGSDRGRHCDEDFVRNLVTRSLQKALLIHGEEVRRGDAWLTRNS